MAPFQLSPPSTTFPFPIIPNASSFLSRWERGGAFVSSSISPPQLKHTLRLPTSFLLGGRRAPCRMCLLGRRETTTLCSSTGRSPTGARSRPEGCGQASYGAGKENFLIINVVVAAAAVAAPSPATSGRRAPFRVSMWRPSNITFYRKVPIFRSSKLYHAKSSTCSRRHR